MSDVPRHALTYVPSGPPPRVRILPLALIWALGIVALAGTLASGRLTTTSELVLGYASVTIALLINAGACLLAARRRGAARLAWTWLAIALSIRALGSLLSLYTAITGTAADLFPVPDAVGYLGYSILALVAVLLFPKPPERLIARFRTVLDTAVITVGVVLVSEATVFYQVRTGVDTSTLSGLTGLGGLLFPALDLATCAVVLTLGMRQPPGNRLAWSYLGAGLVISVVTASVYGANMFKGVPNLYGTPLVAGWIAASALVGLATRVPTRSGRHGWDLALPQRLVPYIPVLAAITVVRAREGQGDIVQLIESILLLALLTVRQVMIVYENVALTRDLESKVASRTSELATMASIVTSSTDAIVGFSVASIVTVWNPAADRLYGLRGADVIGRSPSFLSREAAAGVQELLDIAQRGEKLSAYELDWQRPDGTTVPVAMTVSPVLDNSVLDKPVVQGISIIGQDITVRRHTAETLERAREEALQSSRMKSEFLATMSHEIRTPMNGVIGLTSLLINTDLDALQRKYAEGVRSAGQGLIDVINDILDFSKLEAGRVVIEENDFDLRGLVDEVGNLMAPAAFAKGLELLVSCPPDTPTAVRGDRVRIRQILLNLVSNGVKFTAAGEVAVLVEAQPVEGGRVQLHVKVADSGIGVAAQDQALLFESFTQADASTTRRFGGTGLGLAISRHLVEAMGGTIGLHSELGAGSTFWFEITLAVGVAGTAPPPGPRHDLLAGLRVLVVDDNATTRHLLHAQLTSWRMKADLADNGPAAIERLRAAEAHGAAYDLALLDLPGSDVDGLQVARAISAEPTLVGLPVLILTSDQRGPTAAVAAAGLAEWLTKPVSSSELYDRLMRLFAPRGAAGPPHPASVKKAGRTPVGGRILVVEDNALNQLVAAGLVARLGYEVDAVDDGAQALAALAASSYAAVLMDCHMPGMDGFATTREIRRRQSGQNRTPVIALTAGALAADRERCMAAGMDDYIAKPVDFEALETVLGQWVGVPQPSETVGPPAQLAADASPIDWDRVKVLQGLPAPDGSSLLGTFIATFASRGANRLIALRRASQAGDTHDLTLAAHELKGSASTIGAVRVAALCGLLERTGRAGRAIDPELLDELDTEFYRAATALTDSVAASPAR